tara:strand:- start:4230 stop:6980 length:2751 start_codon:yes stop_codon:yes gene_type:complete
MAFQIHSQSTKSIKPVNIPDPAEKIREQGLRILKGMERELNWNSQQADKISSALQRNEQIEARNREQNFELRQEMSRVYHNQELVNYQQRVKNAEINHRNKNQKWKDLQQLLSLTETGVQNWNKLQKLRKDEIFAETQLIHDRWGLTLKDYQNVQAVEDHIWKKEMRNNAVFQELHHERGVPLDVVNQMRSAGGYHMLAAQKLHAQKIANQTGYIYAQEWDTERQIGGKTYTLGGAFGSNNRDIVLALLDQIDKEQITEWNDKGGWPSSKVWQTSGASRIKQEHRSALLRRLDQNTYKDAQKNNFRYSIKLLNSELEKWDEVSGRKAGAVGFWNSIKMDAGGPDATRESWIRSHEKYIKAAIEGLNNGTLSAEQFAGLEEVFVETSAGKGKYSRMFKPQYKRLQAAIQNNVEEATKLAQLNEQKLKLGGEQFHNKVLDLLMTETPSPKTIAMLAGQAVEKRYKKTATLLADVIAKGQNPGNDAFAKLSAMSKMNNEAQIDITSFIQLHNPSSEVGLQLREQLKTHNKLSPTEEVSKQAKERLKQFLSFKAGGRGILPTAAFASATTWNDAWKGAESLFNRNFKAAMVKNNYNASLSYNEAMANTEAEMAKEDGDWGIQINTDGTRDFMGFVSGPPTDLRLSGKNEFQSNLSSVNTDVYLSRKQLFTRMSNLEKGISSHPLAKASAMSDWSGGKLNPIQIEQAQIKAHNKILASEGKPLIPEHPKWYLHATDKIYNEMISPKAIDLLREVGVNVEVTMNKGKQPIYQTPYYNKAKVIVQRAYPGSYKSHTDSKELDGIDISDVSIRSLLQFMESGRVEKVGRYYLDYDSIVKGLEESKVLLDSKFNAKNQDKIFQAVFKNQGWKIWDDNPDLSDYDREELEDLYRNLNTDTIDIGYWRSPASCNAKACIEIRRMRNE